jgi:FtsP/CotA-like multicopper oxidase with cupredoxin domain
MNRRHFIVAASTTLIEPLFPSVLTAQLNSPNAAYRTPPNALHPYSGSADYTLKIEPCTLEISPGVNIKTVAYNGQVPGPFLRMREGRPVTIDVFNNTNNEDLVHWHGLAINSTNDGAMEEGSPMIAAGGHLRYHFTPGPAGTRWYHTHNSAYANLSLGAYTGQFGFLMVEDGRDPGHYDQEIYLAIHHWEPHFVPMAETMQMQSANHPMTSGSDVGYKYATINQHRLGAGEPIRVHQGQRVLLRLLNASGTENVILALPGHSFKILAMDGNPVPNPAWVDAISLAVAERVDALVEMNNPGTWVLGSTLEKSRQMGLGIVVEYAGKSGEPIWKEPVYEAWDYGLFAGDPNDLKPDETIELTLADIGTVKDPRFDSWAINGRSWPDVQPIKVRHGKRYRLIFRNTSGDQHPMHLHRHSFEVMQIGDRKMSGLMKDVVNVMPMETVAIDFVADNPGDSLLHCHMQLHMDFGFMQIVKYI